MEKTLNEEFPAFWYESNACWGRITYTSDLQKMFYYQLIEDNSINTVDDFLDKSKKVQGAAVNFGTRAEHNSDYTLREYLEGCGVLSKFLFLANIEKLIKPNKP